VSDWWRYPFFVRSLVAVALLAPLLATLSHLVVARRLAFLSTALGQAALTGLTIGLALGDTESGARVEMLGFCLLCALALVAVKRRSSLPPDTLIGVFVAFTLGLGICLLVVVTQRFNVHQIEALMFGSPLTVTNRDLVVIGALVVVVGVVLARHYNELLLDSVSPPLARAAGVRSAWLDHLFVVLLTTTIVLTLQLAGALMVEALVVVPAAASRNVARSLRALVLGSIPIALAAGAGGLALSMEWNAPSGGAIVLVLAALFGVTWTVGRARRARD
jgi:zinc transport system permease protein